MEFNRKFWEQLFTKYFRGPFKLGKHAILSQAIRFKSKNGWYGDTREEKYRTLQHQNKFLEMLIDNEGINLLVPMGNEALSLTSSVINFTAQIPSKITEAMGHSYNGMTTSGKRIIMCPIKHMFYPPARDAQKKVANLIIESYNYLNNG